VASQLLSSDFERNISFYEYLRLTGFMTPSKLGAVIQIAAKEPKIMSSLELDPKLGLKEALKTAITDSNKFYSLLQKTVPEEGEVVTVAQNLHQRVKHGALKLDRSILEFTMTRITTSIGA
jgi:hypothetical protein